MDGLFRYGKMTFCEQWQNFIIGGRIDIVLQFFGGEGAERFWLAKGIWLTG